MPEVDTSCWQTVDFPEFVSFVLEMISSGIFSCSTLNDTSSRITWVVLSSFLLVRLVLFKNLNLCSHFVLGISLGNRTLVEHCLVSQFLDSYFNNNYLNDYY